ncbi:hypothetical protein PILCRDRAFT_389988 [Piloderma croceum F 1598]|uniref:Uncharacterized protein n=1 Tax=Piloderma croceum (strain F 1598) TaxID=765440 RepID=A0A0C3FY87_PILCF|nr:hypothetical protein PILCRDRAFT_389988 [Piloderma croceum F 1598]
MQVCDRARRVILSRTAFLMLGRWWQDVAFDIKSVGWEPAIVGIVVMQKTNCFCLFRFYYIRELACQGKHQDFVYKSKQVNRVQVLYIISKRIREIGSKQLTGQIEYIHKR